MALVDELDALRDDMVAVRHDLHAHPEIAFEEHRTAALVVERLQGYGYEVTAGLAGTGVVGTLATAPGPAIGLRADMDALPMKEEGTVPYRSCHPGRMHACGHDGHTAMLLGAARHLALTRRFKGTVHVIFQPAEENEAGGRAMVEAGLFQHFPVQHVFGMHNWPGLPVGHFAVRVGPMMAACDLFEIEIRGEGSHAAMPHLGTDPILAASSVVQGLQRIASRVIDPLDAGVVSVTQIHAGSTWNVIPDHVVLKGTTRSLKPAVQDRLEHLIGQVTQGIAQAHGCTATVRYERRYPATINHPAETDLAARAAAQVVGPANVERDPAPSMGAEDFAFMINERPGCYIWLGNGPGDGGRTLHNPRYDFNDAALTVGAAYWVTLTEMVLA